MPVLRVLVLAGWGALSAMTTGADNVFDLPLQELRKIQIAAASHNAQSAEDTPFTVTLFTRQDIEAYGARDLADLLNLIPGMTVRPSLSIGRTETYGVRGSPGWADPGVLLLRNGQPIIGMYNFRAGTVNYPTPLDDIERVEVIRGAGSAVYGAGAAYAIVNLVTRDTGSEAVVRVSEHSSGSGYGRLSGEALGMRWSVDAGYTDDSGDEYRHVFDQYGRYDELRDPLVYETLGLRGTDSNHRVELFYAAVDTEGFYGYQGAITPLNESGSEKYMARYDYRRPVGLDDDLHAYATWYRYQNTVTSLVAPQTPGTPFAPADFIFRGSPQVDEYYVGLDWQSRRWDRHTVVLGVDVALSQINEAPAEANYLFAQPPVYLGAPTDADTDPFSSDEQQTTAIYAEDTWQLSPALQVVAGARYDHFDKGGKELSPRLGLHWRVDRRNALRMVYGEAFLAPGLAQLYLSTQPVFGNRALESMDTATFELGHRLQDERYSINTTLYTSETENLFYQAPLPGGNFQWRNLGRQTVSGLELELEWRPIERLSLRAGASQLLAQDYDIPVNLNEEDPAHFVPKTMFSAALGWEYRRWYINVNGYWNRAIEANEDERALSVWHATFRYRQTGKLTWSLAVRNLFNRDNAVADFGPALGRDPQGEIVRDLPLPGRRLWLSARYSW